MNNPAPPPRKALGRGLEALLSASRPTPAPTPSPETSPDPSSPAGKVALLPLAQIQPNPFQPRRHFDPEALAELASSIRAQGVLQPILVRPLGSGFELVAGERRLRAASLAGLTHLPALVRPLNDEASLQVAIIENLQRADLNPVEQAAAFQELGQRFRLTQEQIAERTGKDRATIANYLRLLRLDTAVLEQLRTGALTPGQTRPLIGLEPELQRSLAVLIASQGWSARRVEHHVARLLHPLAPAEPAPPRDPNEREAEEQLARALGAKVAIRAGKRNRGVIEIAYHDLDEFQRLYERLAGPQD
ncbi:MAG TPA: ParB/RepB/Spo0J family partition protein [Terriglobales bacterium]|nr:ParB/RepB/Spo0J family partition protein [Terriglobales bacterium]